MGPHSGVQFRVEAVGCEPQAAPRSGNTPRSGDDRAPLMPCSQRLPGSEKADKRAKLVADEPGAQGVEFSRFGGRYG